MAPLVFLTALYLFVFLAANSHVGSRWIRTQVSAALPGSIDYEYVEIRPSLNALRIWGLSVYDPDGDEVASAQYLRCNINLTGIFFNKFQFRECYARDGRILVAVKDDGKVGISDAFSADRHPKNTRERRPVLAFDDLTLERIGLVINVEDLAFRFDDIQTTSAFIQSNATGFHLEAASIVAESGRLVFSERLMGLGAGTFDLASLSWEALRMRDPWKAMFTPFPHDPGRRPAMLDLPLDWLDLREVRWHRERVQVEEAFLAAGDITIAAGGFIQFLPESPRVPESERGVLSYDGFASIHATPDSPFIDFIVPGMVQTSDGGDDDSDARAREAFKPFNFDGYGNIRLFDGATRVTLRDMEVLGWDVESFEADVAFAAGRVSIEGVGLAELWDGSLSGHGWIEPATGRWEASLCADDIRLPMFLAAFPTIQLPAGLGNATISTVPAHCSTQRDAPLWMAGDLTAKALFQLAPQRRTRDEDSFEGTMWELDATDVRVVWDRPIPNAPFQAMTISGEAALDQRGFVHAPSETWGRPLTFSTKYGEFMARGVFDMVRGRLADTRITGDLSEVSPWASALGLPAFPAGASMTFDTGWSGDMFNPTLERVSAAMERPQADRESPDFRMQLELQREGRALRIVEAGVVSSAGVFDVQGSLALFDGGIGSRALQPSATLSGELRDLDVGALPFELPVDAWVQELTFESSGPIASPSLAGHAVLTEVFVYGEPLDIVDTSFTWDGHAFGFQELYAVKRKGVARVDGWFAPGDGSFEFDATGRDFALEDIQKLVGSGLYQSGDASFLLSGFGSLDAPAVTGSLIVNELRVAERDIGTTSFAIDTSEGVIRALGSLGGLASSSLSYATDGDLVQTETRFDRLPIESVMPEAGGGLGTSWVSGLLQADLTLSAAPSVAGRLELAATSIEVGSKRFVLGRPAVFEARIGGDQPEGDYISLDELVLTDGVREIGVSGRVHHLEEGGDVKVNAVGELDLALLELVPDIVAEAGGTATVDLSMSGTFDGLSTLGVVSLDQVRISPRGLGTTARVDSGVIQFRGDEAVITVEEPLQGELYGGEFVASGRTELQGVRPGRMELEFDFSGATYRIPEQLVLTLNGGLQVINRNLSEPDGWVVRGPMEIVDGRFFRDFDIFSDIFSFGGIGRTVSTFEAPIWQSNPTVGAIELDLTIRGRDRLFVTSGISSVQLDLEIKTDLSVEGRADAMVVVGEMAMLDTSRINYGGRRFEVTDGVLLFDGFGDAQGFPWPVIDLEMETEIRSSCSSRRRGTLDTAFSEDLTGTRVEETSSIFLTMDVEGRLPLDISFALDSRPFYDQRDQLSLILTGCAVDELTGGSGAGPTLELVFRPVIDIVERSVEERFNIDDLDLIPTPEGTAEILVEDEVSERLLWTANATVGTETDAMQTVGGRYSFVDWLILELYEETGNEVERVTIDGGLRFRLRLD